ncbi:MAG TPA: CHRD domain-containing protein [Candidatus Nanopelagicales bacterium]|nr:CHRD domain-containing protein [Candidatus Nanopelagicales bacterium]
MRDHSTFSLLLLLTSACLAGCQPQPARAPGGAAAEPAASSHAHGTAAHAVPGYTPSTATPPSAIPLDPAQGQEIGVVYEAFLSPYQEPGEEEDTPALTPAQFRSTAPSVPRTQRPSRGHGTLRFTRDLSKVYVDVKIEGVKVEDVVMFHIHCGKPDMLGPIMVDLALSGDLAQNLRDGVFSAVVTHVEIEKTIESGHGIVGAFLSGCPIVVGLPDKVKTVAGMEHIARQSELYFNLHTKGQVYFGDIRGKLQPVTAAPGPRGAEPPPPNSP